MASMHGTAQLVLPIDDSPQYYGAWTVIGVGVRRNRKARLLLRCVCGIVAERDAHCVISGGSRSCGCQAKIQPRPCQQCQTLFTPTKGHGRFCSRACVKRFVGTPKGMRNAGSFSRTRPSWNKGIRGEASHSFQRPCKPETRIKLKSRRGADTPNWKGGVSTANQLARKVAEYAEWRKAVFVRDDYTCQFCGARSAAGKRVRICADHIKRFADYPELRYDVNNGRTLCEDCHRKTPTYGARRCTGREAELLERAE